MRADENLIADDLTRSRRAADASVRPVAPSPWPVALGSIAGTSARRRA